ncbi:MAG: SUMF1/EgtB/PvdO family nonheme iron enzyme [Candidatus Paceibacterota bacterium]|jgi:prepilin-type N-terminal cleavage/methylation domain-containing protein
MKLELNKKAFTLIELLVVIAIVGILSGLIVISMNGSIASANDAKRKANISTISKALMIYGTLNGGVYPKEANPTVQCDIGLNCPNLTTALAELLPNPPIDPSGTRYKYFSNSVGSTFTVSAVLSNGQFAIGPVQQCPTDWIDSGHGFCVMKYEAKTGTVSTATGNPVVSITQTAAIAACNALGNGSHLITNAEWTILARDIESVSSNWSGNVLARGWAANTSYGDTWTNSAVAPSTGDSCRYNTGINICAANGTHLYKRTHTLSNGQEIWDFSGNVWEWTNDTLTTAQLLANFSSQGSEWYEYNGTTTAVPRTANFNASTVLTKSMVAPVGTYNSNNGVGRIYVDTDAASDGGVTHAFLRGGYWAHGACAGVFTLSLHNAPGYSDTNVGFRCAR